MACAAGKSRSDGCVQFFIIFVLVDPCLMQGLERISRLCTMGVLSCLCMCMCSEFGVGSDGGFVGMYRSVAHVNPRNTCAKLV